MQQDQIQQQQPDQPQHQPHHQNQSLNQHKSQSIAEHSIRKRSIISLSKQSQISNDQHNSQLQSHDDRKQKQDNHNKLQQQTIRQNRYTLYRQSYSFNWDMNNFDINKAVEEFRTIDYIAELEQDDQNNLLNQQHQKQVYLKIYQTNTETSSLINKKTLYMLKGRDRNGEFNIARLFKEFVVLREKLVQRWPGCYIPPLITKKIGNNPLELMIIRMKFLKNFLKKLSKMTQIYYGTECQIFFRRDTQQFKRTNGKVIQQHLQLKPHTNQELLQKYKSAFANSIQSLSEEQQKIAIQEIAKLQQQLKQWKIDLTRFKDQMRSLIAAKDKYYQAMTRLNTFLIPEYEEIVLDWVNNGVKLNEQNKIQQGNIQQVSGYLINTQEYGSALRDTALSVKNYNQSLWIIYDIFKFELKETQSILQAIQSFQFLVKEKQYLTRNIVNNKEQIDSLSEKKTTLKLFLMSGSIDEKKDRLAKESQQLQQRLQIVKELLNLVLNVLITSIEQFHNDRAQSYKRMLARSSQDQLILVKKLMDFHMFELQLFKRKPQSYHEIQSQEKKDEEVQKDQEQKLKQREQQVVNQ